MDEKGQSSPMDEQTSNSTLQPPLTPTRQQNINENEVQPFTPRSTGFPDHDSDSEFNDDHPAFTPTGSAHGDELPPTYEEAQAQAREAAIEQTRTLDLRVNRMVLGPTDSPATTAPQPQDGTQGPAPEYTTRGNVNRDDIPIQTTTSGATDIPVHQFSSPSPDPNLTTNATASLLNQALEFTKNEPDADARYAPRLSRKIAIPSGDIHSTDTTSPVGHLERTASETSASTGRSKLSKGKHRAKSDHVLIHSPRAFARCYSKALHAHSISPAEFVAFIDGLNIITRADPEPMPSGLLLSDFPPATLLTTYLERSNATFFAPRGLKVRFTGLHALLAALNISEDRGQRAAVLNNILSKGSDAERKATAIEPYAETLTFDVPGPATHTINLQALSARVAEIVGQQLPSSSSAPRSRSSPGTRQTPHQPPPRDSQENNEDKNENNANANASRDTTTTTTTTANANANANANTDAPLPIPGAFPETAEPSSWPHPGSRRAQTWAEWGEDIGRRMER